jgi:uncharacterized membrane protein
VTSPSPVTSPLYDTIMALHVLAAVVGFGALGSTGAYAAAARRARDPFSSASLRRYFGSGRNWAARAVLVVPVLGGVLLGLGGGRDVSAAWPWIGLSIWTAAVGVASAVLWPAEREIQRLLAPRSAEPGPDAGLEDDPGACRRALLAAARRAELASAATSLAFLAALVVMIWQP